LSPGHRGHPPRSLLVCAERGNPVEVQILWVWQADRKEGPIPRRAQDDQEANAGGPKATGNHDRMPVLQLAVGDNRPDTGPSGPARKGADVVR